MLRFLRRSPDSCRRQRCTPGKSLRPRVEVLEERCTPTVTAWTGYDFRHSIAWSDPLNWSAGVPGPSDTALFTSGATYDISHVDAPFTLAGIILDQGWTGNNQGPIHVDQPLTITGNLQWTGDGSFDGDGGISIAGANSVWSGNGHLSLGAGGFLNTGTLTLNTNGSNNKVIIGPGTFTNQGTLNLAGVQNLNIRQGTVLSNTGTVDFTDDCNLTQLFGGTLDNWGTVEKTGGTGTSTVAASFNNHGTTIDVESGTLALATAGGLINSGTLDVGQGGSTSATLNLAVSGKTVSYAGSFTGSGSGHVILGGGTLAVASTGTTFNFPGAYFQWTSGTIDVSSGGTLTNAASGVMTLQTNPGNLNVNGAGRLDNQGTMNLAATTNLGLTSSTTLQNDGTLDLTGDSRLSQSGGGTLTNNGLFEKTGGTGVSVITSAFNNNAASINVTSGTLQLNTGAGGILDGGTFTVSAQCVLNLSDTTAVSYEGNFTGTGAGHVTFSGSVLHVPAAGATFNMSGPLFQLTSGTLNLAGNLTNTGTMTIVGTGGVHVAGAGGLINSKSIVIKDPNSGALAVDGSLTNNPGATIDFQGNGGIGGNGIVHNAGVIKKSQGTGTTFIGCGTLDNTGTVLAMKGTVDVTAAVPEQSGSSLTGGTWSITSIPTSAATLVISPSQSVHISTLVGTAKVVLTGPQSTFTNLSTLSTIAAGGNLTLAGNASFTTAGSLTDNGSLVLSPGSVLTVSGNFTEGSTGKLTLQMGLVAGSPSIGRIISTAGTVSLGGSLTVTSTAVPAVGSSFLLVDNEGDAPIGGAFANKLEGATFSVKSGDTFLTFQISYIGTDDDGSHNVLVTRIS